MTADAVAYVPQRESWDCGIACLAMVAGVSYEDALEAVGDGVREYAQQNGGIPNIHMPQCLGALGLATRTRFARVGPAWYDGGLSGLRLATVWGHYIVLLPDNTVLDPARGRRRASDYEQAFQVWEIHRVAAPPERPR